MADWQADYNMKQLLEKSGYVQFIPESRSDEWPWRFDSAGGLTVWGKTLPDLYMRVRHAYGLAQEGGEA